MLNLKIKTPFEDATAAGTTIIGAGTQISGNINSNGDIRIDGNLKGNLSTKGKVLIGPEGTVDGDVSGRHADILGKVTGNIRVRDMLSLKGKAIIDGNIFAAKLQVEPTVAFNGSCHMGANVIELSSEKAHVATN
jgi:cytoskeletal protein CcmA (bactofilin family)